MDLEQYYREVLIPAQTNQLQEVVETQTEMANTFRDAYGAQDKFSFYTRSITYVNAEWAIIPGLAQYGGGGGNLSNVQVLKTLVSPARRQATELNIWLFQNFYLGQLDQTPIRSANLASVHLLILETLLKTA